MTDQDSAAVARLRHAYTAGQLGFAAFAERLAQADTDPSADVSDLPQPGPRRPGTPLPRPLDRSVLATLAKMSDPVQRCLHAGAVAKMAETEMETARLARNTALVCLHIRHSVPQAQCYEPYGIGRRLFRQAVANSPATLPKYGAGQAREVAARQHAVYERERGRADTGRMVRDAEVRALTRGDYGVDVAPVDLARQLHTSRARMSQVRSTRPRVRSRPRADAPAA
jgi:hypothetical protein